MTQLIIGVVIGASAIIIIFFFVRKLLDKQTKSSFDDLSRKSLTEMMPTLLDLAKRELNQVRQEINQDVAKEKGLIKETLQEMEKNIKEKQEDLKKLELDRAKQFGTITESIKNYQEASEKLREKTEDLAKILGNNKLRGDWGERVAEDILLYAGFQENVHYLKHEVGSSGTIPDFTIILPNKRKVNIDAKFPFANLRAMQEADDPAIKQQYLQKFTQDVKQKIKEVTSREYINEAEDTLDYVIVFVPSDTVYGFIHDSLATVLDEAFKKKVLITSPTSFYATVRIIMESYRHFMYERNIREVLQIIQGFIENFHRFQEEFTGFDDTLRRLRQNYDQIVETRYKKMNVQIRKVEKLEGLGEEKLPRLEA